LGHEGQTEADVLNTVNVMQAHGWNTAQLCSELEHWDGTPEYPRKVRDVERLRWTLDILARIPGVQVELIGICTLKRQVPLPEQFEWAQQVAAVAREFRNVAIYTHNEFDNCAGRHDWGGSARNCAGKQDVAQHVRMYRQAGIQYVTADDSICRGPDEPKTYQFRLANIGAWPASFHPCREVGRGPWDPSLEFLRRVRQYNGEFVLSENVAWMDYSGRCDGLRTCDQNRILNQIATCAAVEDCHYTLHSENLLAGLPPTWIPEAR
jgi:hypothetical protein